VWEVEEGYLISKDRYYLPELDLTPDEMAALWIGSRMVVEPGRPGSKEDNALVKLSLGLEGAGDPTSPPWLRARLHLDSPALPRLLEAVAGRRRVSFKYKPAGAAKEAQRTVDPYALIHRQGAWYLAGRDHMRDAVRHYKLPRITSSVSYATRESGPDFDVPAGFSAEDDSFAEPWVGEEGATEVEVAFSPRLAWWVEQSLGLEPVGTWKDWTLVHLPVNDEEGFVSWVLGFGEDAFVRKPDRVRQVVIKRLRAAARPAAKKTPRPRTGARS
jgi:proteasome accessory factor B